MKLSCVAVLFTLIPAPLAWSQVTLISQHRAANGFARVDSVLGHPSGVSDSFTNASDVPGVFNYNDSAVASDGGVSANVSVQYTSLISPTEISATSHLVGAGSVNPSMSIAEGNGMHSFSATFSVAAPLDFTITGRAHNELADGTSIFLRRAGVSAPLFQAFSPSGPGADSFSGTGTLVPGEYTLDASASGHFVAQTGIPTGGSFLSDFTFNLTVVPAPASALALSALGALGIRRRR